MSYDIDFRVRVEDTDIFVPVYDTPANITWNVGKMIRVSTGLEWKNCEDNGLVKDVMPCIAHGLAELIAHPDKYRQYEAENGWGTIKGCKGFFRSLIDSWDDFCNDYEYSKLVDYVHFWIY